MDNYLSLDRDEAAEGQQLAEEELILQHNFGSVVVKEVERFFAGDEAQVRDSPLPILCVAAASGVILLGLTVFIGGIVCISLSMPYLNDRLGIWLLIWGCGLVTSSCICCITCIRSDWLLGAVNHILMSFLGMWILVGTIYLIQQQDQQGNQNIQTKDIILYSNKHWNYF
jgi:hypothetical protein